MNEQISIEASQQIKQLEKRLEKEIKELFQNELSTIDGEAFYIEATYAVKVEIERLVTPLGLSVHGMSVTDSQFSIIFELGHDYPIINNPIRHIQIHLENDGEYEFELTEDLISKNWWLSVGNANGNFNGKSVEEIVKVIKEIEQAMILSKLKYS
jgi:hypothetical protein